MAGLLSMVVTTTIVMLPLVLCIKRLPVADMAQTHCTRAYLKCASVKDGVERNEDLTEHTINEGLVFVTEHLPHLIGSAGHG